MRLLWNEGGGGMGVMDYVRCAFGVPTGVITSVGSPFGLARNFGANSILTLLGTGKVSPPMTMSATFRHTVNGGTQTLTYHANSGVDQGVRMVINSSDQITLSFIGVANYPFTTTTAFATNGWYTVVCSILAASATLYVYNHATGLIETETLAVSPATTTSVDRTIVGGFSAANFFRGVMSDNGAWNRAFTREDVQRFIAQPYCMFQSYLRIPVTQPAVTGTLAATTASPVLAASGYTSATGTLAATTAGVSMAATGLVTLPGTIFRVTGLLSSLGLTGNTALSGIATAIPEVSAPAPTQATWAAIPSAFQDPKGGTTGIPIYDSVHLTKDGTIVSLGWAGLHATSMTNAVWEFNPVDESLTEIYRWRQWVSATNLTEKIPPKSYPAADAGVNWDVYTYDNHITAYLPGTNDIVWIDHGVFDLDTNNYIRGSSPPSTQRWNTYFTNGTAYLGLANSYNSCYAECLGLNQANLFSTSFPSGGSIGEYGLLEIKQTDVTPGAATPWTFVQTDLGATGIKPIKYARNNAACLGSIMYLGGGSLPVAPTQSGGVFTLNDHGYKTGFQYAPAAEQASYLPPGMVFGQIYFVRDPTQHTFRISSTIGGPALALGETPINPNTGTPRSLGAAANYRMWAIDLLTKAVVLVSDEWALGDIDTWPQLIADTRRSRLILLGKNVSEFDVSAKIWRRLNVANWPAGGYKAVGGRYSILRDKIYFRGTQYTTTTTARTWNSISFPDPGTRSQIGVATGYSYVDAVTETQWENLGGDYIDAVNVEQGPVPFGKKTLGPVGPQDVDIDVTSMMPRLLIENTGITVRSVGTIGDYVFWTSPRNTSFPGKGPKLLVTNQDGVVIDCPLLFDMWIAPTSPPVSHITGNNTGPKYELPILLKFDLTGITSASFAQLKLHSYQQGSIGVRTTAGAFYLNPPNFVDSVAGRTESPGEAQLSDVIFRGSFASRSQMVSDGWWPTAQVLQNTAFNFDGAGNFLVTMFAGFQTASSIRKRVGLTSNNYANGPAPVPSEAFTAWSLSIPPDAGDILGMKLPGMQGSYSGEILDDKGFSLRTEHGAHSAQNPNHLSFFTYAYQPGQGSLGTGENWFPFEGEPWALRKGRTYNFQQQVKCNTFDENGVPVADGEYRLWIDWVLAYTKTGFVLRVDPRVGIQDLLFLQIFHGGTANATHDVTYTVGTVTVASKFIGRTLLP